MKRITILLFVNMLLFIASVGAQTLPTKDAMNSFAKYSKLRDIKQLEAARKQIDNAYKTKSDSNAFKNNLIRSLVYASLANADSNRKYTYTKDPIEEALFSLDQVYRSKFADDVQSEVTYINGQLTHAYLYRANTSLKNRRYLL